MPYSTTDLHPLPRFKCWDGEPIWRLTLPSDALPRNLDRIRVTKQPTRQASMEYETQILDVVAHPTTFDIAYERGMQPGSRRYIHDLDERIASTFCEALGDGFLPRIPNDKRKVFPFDEPRLEMRTKQLAARLITLPSSDEYQWEARIILTRQECRQLTLYKLVESFLNTHDALFLDHDSVLKVEMHYRPQ